MTVLNANSIPPELINAQREHRSVLMQLPGIHGSGIRFDDAGEFRIVISYASDTPLETLARVRELFDSLPFHLERSQPDEFQ
jgi:hypothetical protein